MGKRQREPAPQVQRAEPAPRAIYLLATGLGVFFFCLDLAMISPGVPPGDSGELIAVACSKGVAHAPGYPLYTLLARLAIGLSIFREPAVGVNALSALFNAAACGVLFLATFRWTKSRVAALFSACALGTSHAFWLYSLMAEVFPLNNLLASLLLLLGVCLATHPGPTPPKRGAIFAVAALSVLGVVSHHTTLVLVALPVCALAGFSIARPAGRGGWRWPGQPPWKIAGLAAAISLLGLLPLAYLPLAARGNPVLNWDDPRDLSGLARLLLRKDYGTTDLVPAELVENAVEAHGEAVRPGRFEHLFRLFAEVPDCFSWPTAVLMLLGVIALAREKSRVRILFGGMAILVIWFYSRVNAPRTELLLGVTERFRMLPDLVLALLAGKGLAFVGALLKKLESSPFAEAVGPRSRAALVMGLAIAALAPTVIKNYSAVNQSENTFTSDYGKNVLASLPQKAILFSSGDMIHNALSYRMLCLGERPDLSHVDTQKLTRAWYLPSVRQAMKGVSFPAGMVRHAGSDPTSWNLEWVRLNLPERPVMFYGAQEDKSYEREFEAVPWGLALRLFPKAAVPSLGEQLLAEEAIVSQLDLRSASRSYGLRSMEKSTQSDYLVLLGRLAFLREAEGRRRKGAGDPSAEPLLRSAEEALAKAERLSEGSPAFADVLVQYAFALNQEAIRLREAKLPGSEHSAEWLARSAQLYRQAMELDPSSFTATINLASLYQKAPALNHQGEALGLLERAVSIRPTALEQLKSLRDYAYSAHDVALQHRVREYLERAVRRYERRVAASQVPEDRASLERQLSELQAALRSDSARAEPQSRSQVAGE
jgi:hypothetical protein